MRACACLNFPELVQVELFQGTFIYLESLGKFKQVILQKRDREIQAEILKVEAGVLSLLNLS